MKILTPPNKIYGSSKPYYNLSKEDKQIYMENALLELRKIQISYKSRKEILKEIKEER